MENRPEVWLRGPIEGYHSSFQPIVHSILQTQEEIKESLAYFADYLLWDKPLGMASVAFHIQHIGGVLDRMTTYAKGEGLSDKQFEELEAEGVRNESILKAQLLEKFDERITNFLDFLKQSKPETLGEFRGVGRDQLPSTLGGLLFHAAEHAQRHLGQLLVTVNVMLDIDRERFRF